MAWSVWDLPLWYNRGFWSSPKGCTDLDPGPHCKFHKAKCDANYEETAAHEVGHSFLYAFAGLGHSWAHKGTTTWYGDKVDATPKCPAPPIDIDLMVYYKDYCAHYDRIKATNWDVAKMVMSAITYSVKQK